MQKPNTFTIDDAMEKMSEVPAGEAEPIVPGGADAPPARDTRDELLLRSEAKHQSHV